MKSKIVALISALLLLIMTLCVRYCSPKEAELAGEIILAVLEVMEEYSEEELPDPETPTAPEQERVEEPKIPVFTGEPFVTINGNMPFFGEADACAALLASRFFITCSTMAWMSLDENSMLSSSCSYFSCWVTLRTTSAISSSLERLSAAGAAMLPQPQPDAWPG